MQTSCHHTYHDFNLPSVPIDHTMKKRSYLLLAGLLALAAATSPTARAQEPAAEIVLTLDEALQVALIQNLALQNARLDVANSAEQVREGWSELFPKLDVNATYTRNIRQANPFAGSQAGGLFQSLGFLDWLAYNEQARTDGNMNTDPISAEEFFLRQAQGLQAAGVTFEDSDNPFAVPSVYIAGLSITQKIIDGRALLGAYGASKWLEPFNKEGARRQEQLIVRDVQNAWYATLLAEAQVAVSQSSVQRAQRTLAEISRQVTLGVAPKFQRLSAAVEVSNLETTLLQAQIAEEAAKDNLKLLLGIPPTDTIRLRGTLEAAMSPAYLVDSEEASAVTALSRRPDLKQAEIGVQLERIQLRVATSEYIPTISAFANFNLLGNIPDNRFTYSSVNGDPFQFTSAERGYFDDAYWDRSTSVGLSLTWNVFNGLASHRRVQQRKIAVQKAENDLEFLTRSIRIEIDQNLRNLRAAHRRMQTQQQNLENARLNFDYAETRLREGVATPLEVREASDQLDQTQLNYLQAIHDVLVAQSTYEAAIGKPVRPANAE